MDGYRVRLRSRLFKLRIGIVAAYVCLAMLIIRFALPRAQWRNPVTWLLLLVAPLSAQLPAWLQRRHEELYVEEIKGRLLKAESTNLSGPKSN